MRRPKYTLLITIGLKHNIKTNKYDVEENGITYSMDLEESRLLKNHFYNELSPTVAGWFSTLDKETKKRVERSGKLPPEKDDFVPDISYDN